MSKPAVRSICDLCDDFPDDVQAAEPILRNFGGLDAFHGKVVTVHCYEDNAIAAEVLTEPVLSDLYDAPIRVGTHQGRPLVLHHV